MSPSRGGVLDVGTANLKPDRESESAEMAQTGTWRTALPSNARTLPRDDGHAVVLGDG